MKTPSLTIAPDFSLSNQEGNLITLSEVLADKKVVLFFYPKAFSPVCTQQACNFRSLNQQFAHYNVQPLGISPDSVQKLHRFDNHYHLDFPLLSDPDHAVAHSYEVARSQLFTKLLPVRRVSFIIDHDRTILTRISSELRGKYHSDAALKFLEQHFSPESSTEPSIETSLAPSRASSVEPSPKPSPEP